MNKCFTLPPMKFGERLGLAMKAMNWGPSELSRASGVATATISAIVRRPSDRSDYTEKLVQSFPEHVINYHWLRNEIGSMMVDPVTKVTTKSSTQHGRLPVVGSAQLGDNGHFCDLEYPVGNGDGFISWPSRDENAYCLRCKGESMKPRIRHGEFVVVEPNHECIPGDEVLVVAKDGRVLVKQLAYIRDGMVHLDSVNESHPRISLLVEDVAKIQYVAGIAKAALWKPD